MFKRFRGYFFSGLLVVVPIGVTVWIVWGIFNLFDGWFRVLAKKYSITFLIPNNSEYVYGIGFVLTIFLISMIGFTTQLYFGRKLIGLVDFLFNKIPFISSIYNGLKQVGETLMGRNSTFFEWVGVMEYPRLGLYSLVFIISKNNRIVSPETPQNMLYVFLPTTPNPTSGFFLIVPEEEVIRLNTTVEEGMKMIISCGMVSPKYIAQHSAPNQPLPEYVSASEK